MRISLVSEHANPLAALGGADAGGQNVHVAALAAGLARRGHEVTVHTRRDSEDAPALVRTEDGYVVDHVTAGPPEELPKDELLPHMEQFAARLRERWRRRRPDVVHAHFWMSGLASLDAAGVLGIPVVHTFHALGTVKRRHQGDADTSPASRIRHERRICAEAHRVIATCTDEVQELAALGLPAQRAEVIPCGVDTRHFRPTRAADTSAQRDHDRLLVLGRLVARKGVDTVIEALARINRERDRGTCLVIAGGAAGEAVAADPEARRLRDIARDLGVEDRLTFLGSVDREQVPGLIRSCDVVVTVPWYEPFGIVPVEAMACGRPVVGAAVGGLLDTVVPGETGELVRPRDPDALAAALTVLLDDPDRRRAYGEAGRRRAVEMYDWSAVVARTESVYEDVITSGRRAATALVPRPTRELGRETALRASLDPKEALS